MINVLNSFRGRLTLMFGGLSVIIGLVVGFYLEQVAARELTKSRVTNLSGIAQSVANVLSENLQERDREVSLMSKFPVMTRGALNSDELRQRLEAAKSSVRSYAWMGVANSRGLVEVAAGGMLEGVDVSQRPWFAKGQLGPFMGDLHEAVLLARKLPNPNPNEPMRFIDFASPIYGVDGRVRGVLAAHAHWSWVEDIVHTSVPRDDVDQGVEVLILNRAGQVLYPYDAMGAFAVPRIVVDQDIHGLVAWDGEETYLTSSVRLKTGMSTDLGWRIVVRQAKSKALLPVTRLRTDFMVSGLLATLLLMLLAYRLAATFSQPVVKLSDAAQRVAQGDEGAVFTVASSTDEITRLSEALQGMTNTLISRKHALEENNANLEQAVAERTAKLQEANQQLEQIARRDALTGLHNRLAANEKLRAEFLRMKRTGSIYAVLVMDIDHFKRVNDTYGHETGDQVLKRVANVLFMSARTTDVVARFGGEEFLVLLPDTSKEGAMYVAEKMRKAVADADQPLVGQVTMSIGIAMVGLTDSGEDDAVRLADQALYRAKREGRNRIVLTQEDTSELLV